MSKGCNLCRDAAPLEIEISMAFQPIVDVLNNNIYAYEALVRGTAGQSAAYVFEHVNNTNLYSFDQQCRTTAIALASKLGMESKLSINFMPNAVYEPSRCIRSTLAAAEQYQFPLEKLIFEFSEIEPVRDSHHIKKIVDYYCDTGFTVALDDFGAGYSGLKLLAEVDVDMIKIDRSLIANIDSDKRKRTLLKGIIFSANELNISVLAEGVEREEEFKTLYKLGISLFQGYWFAKPAFESLPPVDFDAIKACISN